MVRMMHLAVLLCVPLGICYFFYLKTALESFGKYRKAWWFHALVGASSLALGYLSTQMFSFVGVVFLHLIVAFLLCRIVWAVANAILKKKNAPSRPKIKKWADSGVLPILLIAIYLFVGHVNFMIVQKTEYTVQTDKAIRAEGYRVALVADVHYGISLDGDQLRDKCEEIAEQNPDIVILCGDIVDDDTTPEEVKEVFAAFGSIKSTFGTFYVHGNHDRPFTDVKDSLLSDFTEKDLLVAIESQNIKILTDDVYEVTKDFVIVGREDPIAGRRTPIETLLADVDKDAFVLTLDHHPTEYIQNGKAGTDLLLSGHTHGGHLFPLNVVMKVFGINDAVYGHTQIDEDTAAIVTSGFAGWCYPVKTCAKSEYVIIDIERK